MNYALRACVRDRKLEQMVGLMEVGRQEVEALLLPADIGRASIAHLSTGERQRLALIRALVGTPRCLLLDEPTVALDSGSTDAVERILVERMQIGVGILMVTHDAGQASRLANKALRLANGTAELVPV